MRNLLDRILRAPDGGGAAAAADGGAAAAAAGAEGAAAAGGQADGGAETVTGYRPDGMADDFYGANDKETIDKLYKAQQATRADIPADAKEYGQFADVTDDLKPYFQTLENDGMFDDIAAEALAHNVPKKAFQAIVGKYMAKASEIGLLEPPLDKAAERAALVPDAARNLPEAAQSQAIERRMNDNIGFINQMTQRGLDKEVADHMIMMLGDSSKGHKGIEFFRSQMSGEGNAKPIGGANGGGPSDPKGDLSRRSGLPENTPDHPKFDRASYDALQADYRRLHGD